MKNVELNPDGGSGVLDPTFVSPEIIETASSAMDGISATDTLKCATSTEKVNDGKYSDLISVRSNTYEYRLVTDSTSVRRKIGQFISSVSACVHP